jgi:hypothetical protein
MKIRARRVALVVAVPGLVVCLVVILGFFLRVLHGKLPWDGTSGTRDHYLAVGSAYSEGFGAGFFLCFFLILLAVGIVGVLDRHPAREEQPIPVGPVGLVKSSK